MKRVRNPLYIGRGRWSARRKVSVVLELLRGEDLETLSRRNGVTAATISGWRDVFLAGGEAGVRAVKPMPLTRKGNASGQ